MPKANLSPARAARAQRQQAFARQRDLAVRVASVAAEATTLSGSVEALDTRVADIEGMVIP